MEENSKNISRLDLYKQVWDTSVTKLAKKYGLSDVGFAKICKKYNIPRPPRGYWAKKAVGQHLQKIPLPNRSSDEIIENLSNQWTSRADSKSLRQIEGGQNFQPIIVAKSLRIPHLFVTQSAEILELCQPNYIGILEPKNKRCLDIHVSIKSLRRALRIMDALIKGLLERKFEVSLDDNLVKVKLYGECLGFGISEIIVSKEIPPTNLKADKEYRFYYNSFERKRIPSGKLCLTIHDISYIRSESSRKNWRDTKCKRLEDSLDAFVIGLVKRAAQKKEYRLQMEEEERQRQEKARQMAEMQQRRDEIKQEKARVAKLITDANNYYKSKQVRDFIASVENEWLKGNSVYVTDDDHESWVKWARDQSGRLDPLSNSPASLLDEVIDEGIE